MPESLTAKTVHGLKWNYLSTVVNFVLQIGVTAVLARIIAPSAFGLVAMAGVFISFGNYFAQLGVGQAIVQRQHLSAHDVRTAFTSSILIGAVFSGLFVALAPLAATLFPHTHGVVTVARVMSLTFVLGGLMAVTQGLLQRRMDFRTMAIVQIGSYVVGYAFIGLVLAIAGFGAWSLVVASLAQSVLMVIAYTVLCRAEIGFGLGVQSLKSLYSFGGRVSLIGFVEFIGSNLDTLSVGHYLGSRATGFYTRATNLATVPLYYFVTSLSGVLMPGYSRIRLEPRRLKSVYLETITVMGAIIIPISWGVAASSHELILTLLGARWRAAVPVLTVLAVAAPFSLLYHLSAIVCEATAHLNERIIITVARVAWLAALLVLLLRFGIVGAAGAFALSELLSHLAYLFVLRPMLDVRLSEMVRAQAVGVVAGLLTAIGLFAIHVVLARLNLPALAVLAVQMVAGAVFLAATLVKARNGRVWRVIRQRLSQAGYELRSARRIGWLVRLMDSLARVGA